MDACVSVISFSSFSFFKKKQENYDLSVYRGQSLLLRIAGSYSASKLLIYWWCFGGPKTWVFLPESTRPTEQGKRKV
jgi:hypothetical protein